MLLVIQQLLWQLSRILPLIHIIIRVVHGLLPRCADKQPDIVVELVEIKIIAEPTAQITLDGLWLNVKNTRK